MIAIVIGLDTPNQKAVAQIFHTEGLQLFTRLVGMGGDDCLP
jgi:hypothetical protein